MDANYKDIAKALYRMLRGDCLSDSDLAAAEHTAIDRIPKLRSHDDVRKAALIAMFFDPLPGAFLEFESFVTAISHRSYSVAANILEESGLFCHHIPQLLRNGVGVYGDE